VITRDLRYAVRRALAAAGFPADADPGLRPTGIPGGYAASVALTLGANPRETAAALAAALAREEWIAQVEVTGPGYLTITVTPEALAAVADNIATEGAACVTSDALTGETAAAVPPGDPLAATTWEEARTALAARLTARLADAAGATVAEFAAPERNRLTAPVHPSSAESAERLTEVSPADPNLSRRETAGFGGPDPMPVSAIGPAGARSGGCGGSLPRATTADVAAAVAFAGRDAVTFTLARAIPGKPVRVDPEIIARHVLSNPAYAVRYAHARAASGVRWAAASSAADTIGSGEAPQSLLADPPELLVPAAGADILAVCAIGPSRQDIGGYGGSPRRGVAALLDALSWLPERVAAAARRGRPDEFARYLEDLASVTVDVLSSASHPGSAAAPGSDRLTLAMAARTGLAAGLGLLEVTAPERLLAETYRGAKL
jgi:arginyl-tRNA synthetase